MGRERRGGAEIISGNARREPASLDRREEGRGRVGLVSAGNNRAASVGLVIRARSTSVAGARIGGAESLSVAGLWMVARCVLSPCARSVSSPQTPHLCEHLCCLFPLAGVCALVCTTPFAQVQLLSIYAPTSSPSPAASPPT